MKASKNILLLIMLSFVSALAQTNTTEVSLEKLKKVYFDYCYDDNGNYTKSYVEYRYNNKPFTGIATKYFNGNGNPFLSEKATFVDGLYDGPYETFHPMYKNKKVVKGQYKKNQKVGTWYYYNQDGTVRTESYAEDKSKQIDKKQIAETDRLKVKELQQKGILESDNTTATTQTVSNNQAPKNGAAKQPINKLFPAEGATFLFTQKVHDALYHFAIQHMPDNSIGIQYAESTFGDNKKFNELNWEVAEESYFIDELFTINFKLRGTMNEAKYMFTTEPYTFELIKCHQSLGTGLYPLNWSSLAK